MFVILYAAIVHAMEDIVVVMDMLLDVAHTVTVILLLVHVILEVYVLNLEDVILLIMEILIVIENM